MRTTPSTFIDVHLTQMRRGVVASLSEVLSPHNGDACFRAIAHSHAAGTATIHLYPNMKIVALCLLFAYLAVPCVCEDTPELLAEGANVTLRLGRGGRFFVSRGTEENAPVDIIGWLLEADTNRSVLTGIVDDLQLNAGRDMELAQEHERSSLRHGHDSVFPKADQASY